MPLTKLNFRPGINKEETDYSNEGGWVDGDKIRFRKGRVEKIGGWEKFSPSSIIGSARALHAWISLEGTKYLGIGTTNKYYIEEGGNYNDVTPIRTTTTNTTTFAATNGSSTITVTDNSHGAVNGDFVTFSSAVSLGGNITATVLNQEYQIDTVTGTNTYTITAKNTSGTTVTANASDSGNGGSATDSVYQINSGLDVFVAATGWGVGTWGAGGWGSSTSLSASNQLRLWTHDNFGEDLMINVRGGGIFRWKESDGTSTRAVTLSGITGANLVPTVGLQVITSETDRHLIVLGADPISGSSRTGTVDPMLVAFSDQENALDFEPLTTNTAGSLRLSSGSAIIGGLKSRQEILIWTDTSLYSMNFIGPPLTFAINLINEGAGLLGPKAAVNSPKGVFFMSKKGFYFYNGAVQKLPCSVLDHIFSDFNLNQSYKVFGAPIPEHNEIIWFYPSANSSEVNRYVIYNYLEKSWSIGTTNDGFTRTAWNPAYSEQYPLAASKLDNTDDNYLYNHEFGHSADGSNFTAFIESSDFDLDPDGERFMFISRLIPDLQYRGNSDDGSTVSVTIKGRNFPLESLSSLQTISVNPTTKFANTRARSRQSAVRIENTSNSFGWRLGDIRLDLRTDGRK